MSDITDIKSMTKSELSAFITGLSFQRFRADQLFDWLNKKHAKSYDEMTNLPKDMREKLKEAAPLPDFRTLACLDSKKDGTKKFLFGLGDGNAIESVFMPYKHGNSVCISSQVGCRMGCTFCASTLGGLVRNLSAGEMLEQVYEINRITGERISNVVVMGSGEPLDNYDNLLRFIELISCEEGMNLSQRNITVSTCGIVPKIYELAKEKLTITLAISLHASNDEKRREIMPVAKSFDIKSLLEACRFYFKETGRRLSFEYSLIKDVNDSAEDAKGLAVLLSGMPVHINLIPVNPVKERKYERSNITNILNFRERLEKYGINATIRRDMGADIDAACGQLRRSYELSREEGVK